MSATNWDATDLKSVAENGLIREDVMNQIWDISRIPLPYTDLVGTDTVGNDYYEWTTDKLNDPELAGWVVDGADSDQDDSQGGSRIGNHAGILTKEVRVSTRAQNSNVIGRGNELSYQVMMRQRELRRNVEANALHTQGSQASDANAGTPGIPAGLAAMMTQFDTGSGATGGGFSGGNWTAVTAGTGTALTETMVRDACQATWEDGGDPSVLMSVPGVIRQLSEYMFTSSSRIATLTRETKGADTGQAMGTVNTFITDFGVTVDFMPNRIQRPMAGTQAAVYIFDPAYFRLSYLHGYRVEPLAKTGLSDKRLMAVDWGQKALQPDAGRVLLDIDYTMPVVQA